MRRYDTNIYTWYKKEIGTDMTIRMREKVYVLNRKDRVLKG